MAVCFYGGIARAELWALDLLAAGGRLLAHPGVTGAQHRPLGGESFSDKDRR